MKLGKYVDDIASLSRREEPLTLLLQYADLWKRVFNITFKGNEQATIETLTNSTRNILKG